ncbi:LytR family transcriptional regulator [Bacillus sp. Y1]|nr:LytR family transcriptional regulator [Bacillus sp. Y1]
MKPFDKLPKNIKKTIRYINQDVKTLEDLEQLEKTICSSIERKKEKLKN